LQNSTLPLRIISSMGMIISLISIIFGIYNIIQRLYMNIKLAGWTSLMVVNLFLFGVVLFSLGIIGEYLIRIIQSTNQIPPYTIRQKYM
ncbi:MAG: glycosyltransferase, partial [Candidatus Latescibacteria bacterium]|nr:glycosyltransferase [Candidatus Latescibacterota bacterium]